MLGTNATNYWSLVTYNSRWTDDYLLQAAVMKVSRAINNAINNNCMMLSSSIDAGSIIIDAGVKGRQQV